MEILFIALLIGIVLTIILCSIAYAILKKSNKQNQQETNTVEATQEQNNLTNKKEPTSTQGCLVTLAALIISIIIVFGCAAFFIRTDIKETDVKIYPKNISLLNIELTIEPHTTIYDLEVKIEFFDNNKQYINSITRDLGKVKKNQQYTITISTGELIFSTISADNIRYKVTGKKLFFLSYMQLNIDKLNS